MSIRAIDVTRRRGACPALSAPMPTGDGLLVRLMPIGTIALEAFSELCAAAQMYGNGVIEVTTRGNIQVRGLRPASAAQFAAAIAASGVALADGVPILSNALAGLDPNELIDAGLLAADLRDALLPLSLAARVAAKVSVVIDGGGALSLDGLGADVRLCAEAVNGTVALRVSVGGDGASAAQLGHVAIPHGVEVAARLLEVLAQQGREARARDILATDQVGLFGAAIADRLMDSAPLRSSAAPVQAFHGAEPKTHSLETRRLRDGSIACSVALPFGHADATLLQQLIEHAHEAGAAGVRTAPDRTLLAIGLTDESGFAFADAAQQLGFIVRHDDPRRHVITCAGAPICNSAHIPARALGPIVAAAAAHSGDSLTIHISGCAKGCAHPAPAVLTIVGTPEGCALVYRGSPRDVARAVVPADRLATAVAEFTRQCEREGAHA